eukprot:12543549-Prorocentrum_lima.AAC.1
MIGQTEQHTREEATGIYTNTIAMPKDFGDISQEDPRGSIAFITDNGLRCNPVLSQSWPHQWARQ